MTAAAIRQEGWVATKLTWPKSSRLPRLGRYAPKPTNKAELKTVLEAIWKDLPQAAIDLAVLAFRRRLQACIRADGGHFEHLLI